MNLLTLPTEPTAETKALMLLVVFCFIVIIGLFIMLYLKIKDKQEWDKILDKHKSGEVDEPDDFINFS